MGVIVPRVLDRPMIRWVSALVLTLLALYALSVTVEVGRVGAVFKTKTTDGGVVDSLAEQGQVDVKPHEGQSKEHESHADAQQQEQPKQGQHSSCQPYVSYAGKKHGPFSSGAYNLSFQRPMPPDCRKFRSPVVDETIERFKHIISDPDLYRLFENTFPNTLDTTVKFKGYATKDGVPTDEELTFLITGDINAMWLRDSANQMQSYLPLLAANAGPDSLASLFRGVINLQSRYILEAPYCNSFQAPEEAGLKLVDNAGSDKVRPPYDKLKVWECKYELDSLAAFLQISAEYFEKTGDHEFFSKYRWVDTVKTILHLADEMKTPTRGEDGKILKQPYTFTRHTIWGDSLVNGGKGRPVRGGTGLIRSAFRPSDDACIYQLFIPGNMMFSHYLRSSASIMQLVGEGYLSKIMLDLAQEIHDAIEKWGIVQDEKYGRIYAYEVDGFGSYNMMDDANIPSLLSAPVFGYLNTSNEVYRNTRKRLLSEHNSYYERGPVLSAIGGLHDGPGMPWPMARIVEILTTDDDAEIEQALRQLVGSTAGLGLIHESVNSFDQYKWTRQW